MYKYLSLTGNLQEMMIMLKSLPAFTLIFDRKSNLVDINEPALKLLKLRSIEDFNNRKGEMFPKSDYIKTIIQDLKQGKTVRYEKTQIKYADNSIGVIELCACMINGQKDLYLFQLFEIFPAVTWNLGSFSYNPKSQKTIENIPSQSNDWAPNLERIENKEMKEIEVSLVENDSIQEKIRYRRLTKLETLVNELVVRDMSISQIANLTNKTNLGIRTIMRRIEEKQKNIKKI
ncbi:hypothetical protein Palpr_0417 [Paludibacter propionicigenes WB4]|uniref:PAS domain-containing protein n=1 Tax=Paludibacter propionicigenes (strain DSM 17365 / JCM 13257 / WB4) TaxID=694427 RepID=E4T1I3_PALPW|nr:hypothetical protein [Paludibacter propionicigenes]ADQ78577.1 hypothetical protein Palpr_0417 [Paludibacter propionicigenes WB4]